MDVKARRKQILSDPLAAFVGRHPEASGEHLARLEVLRERYHALKNEHQETRERTRKISRKIGQAKRDDRPVTELLNAMQQANSTAKSLEETLKNVEREILAFFDPAQTKEDGASKTASFFGQRIYPVDSISTSMLSVSLIGDELSEWNRYVERNPAASIYHRAEWRNVIHNTFGHQSLYYAARDDQGRIVGVLPLIRLKSHLFGDFIVSMPYFNYGGAVADHPAVETQLMEAANQWADRRGVSHIEYRDDMPREGLPVRSEKVSMILPLPSSPSQLWNRFTSKLRSQIRRPQREDPYLVSGGPERLDDFYKVFARNMRDLGTPVYGKAFFRNILTTFPENSWVTVMYLRKQPVSAGFLIGYGQTLEIPWASTIRDVNHLSVNMLLYWEVLKAAIERGYQHFDFGRSSRDASTFRFKQQWGARPKQLYWHYWLREDRELPALSPSNHKYAMLIALWKRLPVPVANRLGPPVVKNLP